MDPLIEAVAGLRTTSYEGHDHEDAFVDVVVVVAVVDYDYDDVDAIVAVAVVDDWRRCLLSQKRTCTHTGIYIQNVYVCICRCWQEQQQS